jgi:hypothetical protein
MQKSEAERIVAHVLEVYASIGSMDSIISSLESEIERRRLAAAIGDILRVTREEVLLPIFHEFPDLVPNALEGKAPR